MDSFGGVKNDMGMKDPRIRRRHLSWLTGSGLYWILGSFLETPYQNAFLGYHVLQLGCSSSAGSAGGAIGFTAKPVVSANPRTKSCLRGYDDMSCQILQVSSL